MRSKLHNLYLTRIKARINIEKNFFEKMYFLHYQIIKQYTLNTSIYYTGWLHVSTPIGSSSRLLIESCH